MSEQYMNDAHRTLSTDFHPEMAPPTVLLDAIAGVKAVTPQVDAIKKALFYGKHDDNLAFSASLVTGEDYGELDPLYIHAILGIYTEAAELVEILEILIRNRDGIYDPDFLENVQKKLTNESGDVMWYQALLFKLLGTNFERVGQLNIEKLRKRFPVKFEEDLAVNRDEAVENVVFD